MGKDNKEKRGILGSIRADHLNQLGFFVNVFFFRLLAGRQTESIGLALLLLARKRSIRLLMIRGRIGPVRATVGPLVTHLVATKVPAATAAAVGVAVVSTTPIVSTVLAIVWLIRRRAGCGC